MTTRRARPRRSADNARWPDRTRTKRSQRRRELLAQAAHEAGYDSWYKLETAVINGEARIETEPTAYIL